ncbi:MAG: hypothetical protein V3U68_07155 [Bacteroidota bacterium]
MVYAKADVEVLWSAVRKPGDFGPAGGALVPEFRAVGVPSF